MSTEHKDSFDGLLNAERDELIDRIAYLEKKTTEQAEDMACLKSAVADGLRRISLLESAKGMLPPQTQTTGTRRNLSHRASSESRVIHSATGPAGSRPRLPGAPRSNAGDSLRRKRVPSAGEKTVARSSNILQNSMPPPLADRTTTKSAGVIGRPATGAAKAGSREPTYLKNDGILKMYLHGRCLNFYAPTDIEADYDFSSVSEVPEEQLKLEWVYGYRGKDCRNNVFLLPTGEIIYFIAAVVVLYNIEEHCQRHYLEHNDDIKSLAVHPDRITVASGQTAGHSKHDGQPHIRIWNSVSLETLHVIGLGAFENSVCCLSFSKTDGGARLVAVDDASDHTISVWDWQKSRRVTETKASAEPVIAVEFSPVDEETLVTIGKSHLGFWTFDGSTLGKKQGIYEKYDKPKFTLCMIFAENGDLVTGDSNGNIFVWPRGSNKIGQAVLGAHTGGIFALCFNKNGQLMSGGGKDHRIVQFDAAYNPTGLVVELTAWYGPVRTIVLGPGEMLIVGTTQGDILQGSLGTEFTPIIQGHSDEFWALAIHPQTHHFITSGKDGNLFLWDSLTKRMVWAENLSEEVQCACFFPATSEEPSTLVANGNGDEGNHLPDSVPVIAVGTNSGRWIILDATLHQVISAHHESAEAIQCVAFSPNGQFIAFGSRDNFIYIYNVLENGTKYTRLGKCSGHSSFVLHLDWSEDSQFMRTTSGDNELLYWSPANCRQVTAVGSMCDVRWATQTCHLGFEVAGIWPKGSDGSDINAVARSHSMHLLATADDFGQVNLFRYPVSQLKSKSRSYAGHSSHVTNVAFLFDDSRLISTGGADTAILQWEVLI